MHASTALSAATIFIVVMTSCASHERRQGPAVGERIGSGQPEPVEFDQLGAPFKTTWTRPADPPDAWGPGPQFVVSKLSESANAYRLHLQLKPAVADDPRIGQSEKPIILMSVNLCPAAAEPPFTGLIQFGGPASTLTIPRNQLPSGDLRVIVRAHGQETSIDLRHDAKGIRPMLPSEVAGYFEIPADPANGEPGVAVTPTRDDCP